MLHYYKEIIKKLKNKLKSHQFIIVMYFKNKIISKFAFESQEIHKTFYLSQILKRVPDSFYPSAR